MINELIYLKKDLNKHIFRIIYYFQISSWSSVMISLKVSNICEVLISGWLFYTIWISFSYSILLYIP